jgi:large subunit ribosomal protein L10
MAKSKENKTQLLKQYKEILEGKPGYIIVDSDKLDSTTLFTLRKQLKEIGANCSIIKNTIFKLALQEAKQPLETQDFTGASAIITFEEDPTGAAKILKLIQKETELVPPRYGVMGHDYIDGEKVMALADIPSREVLYAKLLGTLNAPLTGIMNTFTGNLTGFIRVLQSVSENK